MDVAEADADADMGEGAGERLSPLPLGDGDVRSPPLPPLLLLGDFVRLGEYFGEFRCFLLLDGTGDADLFEEIERFVGGILLYCYCYCTVSIVNQS